MIANFKTEFPNSLEEFDKQNYFWPVPKSELEGGTQLFYP